MAVRRLTQAKRNKKDEFYTQLSDIENELKHYKEHFKNKVVYCNCDDPKVSNFYKFFYQKFKVLGLKKLISSCYRSENMELFSKNDSNIAVYAEYNGKGDVKIKTLESDGDFRNQESIELLKRADIVVTNPPFSLFREYVAQLMEYDKKFVIVGHQNAITYREIFKFIKENKLWLGYGFQGGAGYFINKHYIDYATASSHKDGMIRVSGVHWYTNMDNAKRNEDLILYKKYYGNETDYYKYDFYDAINIDKTKEIPQDYKGMMGVPITFLDKYNPSQFEIIDGIGRYSMLTGPTKKTQGTYLTKIGGKPKYARIVIKNKNPEQ